MKLIPLEKVKHCINMDYLIDENNNLIDVNNWKTENFGSGKISIAGGTSFAVSSARRVGFTATTETGMAMIPAGRNLTQLSFSNDTNNTLKVTAIYGSTVKTIDSAPNGKTNIPMTLTNGGPVLLMWTEKPIL